MIVPLCPPIYTYPSIHFRKIDMTTKNSVGFNRFPPASIIQGGGGDAMLFHDGSSYHLETSPLICGARIGNEDKHCVESVQILSFFWSLFSRIRTEYGKMLRISPYSVRMQENTDQKKLRIWTLFTQRTLVSIISF